MWLMMLGGLGMFIVAMMRYYKENNADNVADLIPGKEQNKSSKKLTVSTIQGELVPPKID